MEYLQIKKEILITQLHLTNINFYNQRYVDMLDDINKDFFLFSLMIIFYKQSFNVLLQKNS